jgi:hypothetical protein
MYVYLNGDNPRGHPNYVVRVAPAADNYFTNAEDCPSDWKEANGSAKQIDIVFAYGRAEVDENMGRYLVKRGIAERSRIIQAARALVGLDNGPSQ